MPSKQYALKTYTPPDKTSDETPVEPKPLSKTKVDKVKARIRTVLTEHEVLDADSLRRKVVYAARRADEIPELTVAQYGEILSEMEAGDEFALGYGAQPTVVVKP